MSEYDRQRDIDAEGQRAAIYHGKQQRTDAFDPDPPTRAYVDILKSTIDDLRTTISQLQAEIERIRKERDRERKHVSKLMEERDHARKALDAANGRIRELHHNPASGARATFERCRIALEHASHALDGVVSLDDEDEGKDGGSATCQHAKRTVDGALKEVRAALGGSNDKG